MHRHVSQGLARTPACSGAPWGATSACAPACPFAAVAHSCLHPCRRQHVHTHWRRCIFATAGDIHLHRTPSPAQAALQSHMSCPQGTQWSLHSMAPAQPLPRPCPPRPFPTVQEATLFPQPAVSPPATPRTGLSSTAHVQGATVLPVSHQAPWAAGMTEGMSTHLCTQICTCVHTREVTVAHLLHAHAADNRPNAHMEMPSHAILTSQPPSCLQRRPHMLLHTHKLPFQHTHKCVHTSCHGHMFPSSHPCACSCTCRYTHTHACTHICRRVQWGTHRP